jgi:hypothetical protein
MVADQDAAAGLGTFCARIPVKHGIGEKMPQDIHSTELENKALNKNKTEKSEQMPKGKDPMCILGELICRLNPYTENPKPGLVGVPTGDMQIATLSPAADPPEDDNGFSTVEIEVERNYPAQWTFKGQTQNINTAVRIPYRFPVYDENGNPRYWLKEYLLIGYVGAGGGG